LPTKEDIIDSFVLAGNEFVQMMQKLFGSISAIVSYEWCCFIDCFTRDLSILEGIGKSILYNIFAAVLTSSCPPVGLVAISVGLVFEVPLAKKINERIEICDRICN
jgi:hypothetical protein